MVIKLPRPTFWGSMAVIFAGLVAWAAEETLSGVLFSPLSDWLADRLDLIGDFFSWRFAPPAISIIVLAIWWGGWELRHRLVQQKEPEREVLPVPSGKGRSATARKSGALSTAMTKPYATSLTSEVRAINESGARKHTNLPSGSLEFIYGAHESTTDISIKLQIQLPDGRWVSKAAGIVPGIFYYPVRFVFPDDFEGEKLLSGTYHVTWLRVTRRRVRHDPLSILTIFDPSEHYVYDETVISTEEFGL
jgi:hypothetical protein